MIRSAEEFIRLRTSEVPEQYLRAAHEEAPLEVWRDVVLLYPDMRWWVAQNKTVPLSVLELLCSDPSPAVRRMVAIKRKLTEALQLILAQDRDESVRQALACNAKATRGVLERLATDESHFVREEARQRLRALPYP